jgi:hypothetical protein
MALTERTHSTQAGLRSGARLPVRAALRSVT